MENTYGALQGSVLGLLLFLTHICTILTWSSWVFIFTWLKNKLIDLGLLYTHTEIMETFFLQKLCKTYTTEFDVYKMYLKFKQTFVHVLYTKLRGLWQLNLLYKIYINVCQNVGYILHIFCVRQGRSKKSLHHKNYVHNLCAQIHTKCRPFQKIFNACGKIHTNTVKCVMVCNVYFPFPKILQLYERVYAQRYIIYKKSKKNVTFLLLNCSNIYNL